MSKKRKVCVVVTARPSYSRIKSALQSIKDHPQLELQLVVAASALLAKHGSAIKNIENDGFHVDAKIYNLVECENLTAPSKTTGMGIIELSNTFLNLQPDCVVTIADRYETISTAIAASYMNIPLIHIQGGEVTGNIDEKVRHAITKLSDIHLVASEAALERLIKLGEDEEYIINTGCPSLDLARDIEPDSPLGFDIYEKYGGVGSHIDLSGDFLVVLQHPVTTEHEKAREQVTQTLETVKELDLPTLWFWPNVDAGADGTSKGIRAFRELNKDLKFHFFKHVDSFDFLKLLNRASVLIGNSSAGIRECSFLGVPVVNIGTRQNGRDRGPNVIDIDYNSVQLKNAILNQIAHGKYESSHLYGDGRSGTKIAEAIYKTPLRFHKTLTY